MFSDGSSTRSQIASFMARSWHKGSDLGTSGGAITKQKGRTPLQPFSCVGPGHQADP